jgi:ABC-type oligopeptide transport system substrate-binding subunit
MEKKMKKLMLVAALGAAALFTACGDDSSSSAKAGTYSCEVKVEGQSVITEWNVEGVKTRDVYTIVGDSLKIETADTTMTRPLLEGEDLAFEEDFAKKGCETAIKMYEEAKNEAK